MTAGGTTWQGPPSSRPPGDGNWNSAGTGERLRAALSARSAQVGSEPIASSAGAYGPPSESQRSWQGGSWGSPAASERYDGSGYTRSEGPGAGYGDGGNRGYGGGGYGSGYGSGYGGGPGPGSGPGDRYGGGRPPGRAPLLPRWAKAALAVGLVLSAVFGAVLGLHSSGSSSSQTLPPARESSYGQDRARVAITSLYRQGKFVTLELELTNLAPLGSDNSWSVNTAFSNSSGYDLSGIRLLEPQSGTSIRPAEDGAGDCICTRTISLTIEPGSSSRVSAQFPAPAADVKTLTVDIPGVGSFRDVKLG